MENKYPGSFSGLNHIENIFYRKKEKLRILKETLRELNILHPENEGGTEAENSFSIDIPENSNNPSLNLET